MQILRALFCGLQNLHIAAQLRQMRVNIIAALTAIKPRAAGALHTSRCLRAALGGIIDFGRVDIITNAEDHEIAMT